MERSVLDRGCKRQEMGEAESDWVVSAGAAMLAVVRILIRSPRLDHQIVETEEAMVYSEAETAAFLDKQRQGAAMAADLLGIRYSGR